jgi:Co/Zn/Cd efflux system component
VSSWANSLCLVASAFFDLTEGVVLFVSVWGQAIARSTKPSMSHSYGFDRYEVIGRFGAASYFAFVCLWIFFEGAERILEVEPTFIHGSYLIQIGIVGVVLQLLHVLAFRRFVKGGAVAGSERTLGGFFFLFLFLKKQKKSFESTSVEQPVCIVVGVCWRWIGGSDGFAHSTERALHSGHVCCVAADGADCASNDPHHGANGHRAHAGHSALAAGCKIAERNQHRAWSVGGFDVCV